MITGPKHSGGLAVVWMRGWRLGVIIMAQARRHVPVTSAGERNPSISDTEKN